MMRRKEDSASDLINKRLNGFNILYVKGKYKLSLVLSMGVDELAFLDFIDKLMYSRMPIPKLIKVLETCEYIKKCKVNDEIFNKMHYLNNQIEKQDSIIENEAREVLSMLNSSHAIDVAETIFGKTDLVRQLRSQRIVMVNMFNNLLYIHDND